MAHVVQIHEDADGQLASSITLSGVDYIEYFQYQAAARVTFIWFLRNLSSLIGWLPELPLCW